MEYFTKCRRWLSSEIQGNVFIIQNPLRKGDIARNRLPLAFVPAFKIIHHLKLRIAFQRDHPKARLVLENSYMYPRTLTPWRFFSLFTVANVREKKTKRNVAYELQHTDTWTRLRNVRALMRPVLVPRGWPARVSNSNNVFNVINSASYGAEEKSDLWTFK